MNIARKIYEIIGFNTNRQSELVSGGKVVKPGAIRSMPTKCCICDKTFKVNDNSINYFYALDATVHLLCDSCYQKFLDSWTVVSCERIQPHGGYAIGGTAYNVKMKDGTFYDMISYGNSQGAYGEIPVIFNETLRPYILKYLEEVRKLTCSNVQVVDTYDEQKLIATFESGDTYTINFKFSSDGIRYNPEEIKKLTADQINRINIELKDKGYFKFYIREVK